MFITSGEPAATAVPRYLTADMLFVRSTHYQSYQTDILDRLSISDLAVAVRSGTTVVSAPQRERGRRLPLKMTGHDVRTEASVR